MSLPRTTKLSQKLKHKTCVMGILNVTPDSFFDGGSFYKKEDAVSRAMQMVEDGADIIDVGGESTRPGSIETSIRHEMSRVVPVVRAIARRTKVFISVDTRKSRIAEEAIKAGASIINDVSGLLHDDRMANVISKSRASVIVMHTRGIPENMSRLTEYHDVVAEAIAELCHSIDLAVSAGIRHDRIIIDPGIGFAKKAMDSITVINRLDEFKMLGYPVCVGASRKSFIGKTLGYDDPSDRLYGSIAASVLAVARGANIVRVHDVRETVDAIRITDAVLNARPN